MATKESMVKQKAVKLVCPFTPYLNGTARSYTCIAGSCMMWVWDEKPKSSEYSMEEMDRKGHCSLVWK